MFVYNYHQTPNGQNSVSSIHTHHPHHTQHYMIPTVSVPQNHQHIDYDEGYRVCGMDSPTLNSAFLSPCVIQAPSSNGSSETNTSTASGFSNATNTSGGYSMQSYHQAASPPPYGITSPPPQIHHHTILKPSPPQYGMPNPPPTAVLKPSPPQYGIPTPPTVLIQQSASGQHVVCSPGPVISVDPTNLQSAWMAPSNYIGSPVASHLPHQVAWMAPVQPHQYLQRSQMYHQQRPNVVSPVNSTYHEQKPAPIRLYTDSSQSPSPEPTLPKEANGVRKSARVRCKSCSSSSRANKEYSEADLALALKDNSDLLKQLPEFFGEPLLHFEEFVHYTPVFRTPAVKGDFMMYFKIPRTTKERELNIPQRLTELFIRTFGPEYAPERSQFERISPHSSLCDVRMVIRSVVVKALAPVFTPYLKDMEDTQNLFNTIFRFAGIACVKDVCPTAPQVWCATVTDPQSDTEVYENVGVVSLFNYHLFRRKVVTTVV